MGAERSDEGKTKGRRKRNKFLGYSLADYGISTYFIDD